MSRGPSTFRQRDLEAAVKAMRAAGVEVAGAVLENGKITIIAEKTANRKHVSDLEHVSDLDGEACNSGNEWDSKYGQSKTQAYK